MLGFDKRPTAIGNWGQRGLILQLTEMHASGRSGAVTACRRKMLLSRVRASSGRHFSCCSALTSLLAGCMPVGGIAVLLVVARCSVRPRNPSGLTAGQPHNSRPAERNDRYEQC